MTHPSSSRLNIAILFGGRSAEHEVSLQSARNVIAGLDRDRYHPLLIGIDKDGTWRLLEESACLQHADDPKRIALGDGGRPVTLVAAPGGGGLVHLHDGSPAGSVDAAFPVLHGTFGEDGTLQGLLELADIPCVGSGVLGSALAMDKDVTKRLLAQAGLPTPSHYVLTPPSAAEATYAEARRRLGETVFIKPANLGSSVGISKVHGDAEFRAAVQQALTYDTKILVEEAIEGVELECSVLGNDDPVASVPGEVATTRAEFYSYDAKYIDDNAAELHVPARIPPDVAEQTRALAIRAFTTCCCYGMARVDFFLRPDGALLINELNTIPGFTRISMYPRLWEATGISNRALVDRLIQLAQDRFRHVNRRRTSYGETPSLQIEG